jgi:hypothetical protein
MWLKGKNLALAVLVASITIAGPVQGQTLASSPGPTSHLSPLVTTNRDLQASLERISRGSALWREAMVAIGKTGRHALVVTPADVVMRDSEGRRIVDSDVLAEAIPIVNEDSEISAVVIVVNLRLVRKVHDARMSVPRDFEADLDRILVHEVYGHAVPYLLAGDISGRCADPGKEKSASDACSIRRENAVRAQLGLGRREDRGHYSLAMASGAR